MATDSRPKINSKGNIREKVVLKPGFHLMDWIRLTSTQTSKKAVHNITHAELALHNSTYDCWMAYQGKVYNVTQYLPYHPGGEKKLFLGAGKDATDLFNKYHRWVNIDAILGKCFVGNLISVIEDDGKGEEEIDGVIKKEGEESISKKEMKEIGTIKEEEEEEQNDDKDDDNKNIFKETKNGKATHTNDINLESLNIELKENNKNKKTEINEQTSNNNDDNKKVEKEQGETIFEFNASSTSENIESK
jgi:cytochrome b involved in lipid metabolism